MSPAMDDSSETSRAPLFDDPDDQPHRIERERMEAIQAALTDIIALEMEHVDKPQSLAVTESERQVSFDASGPTGKEKDKLPGEDNDDDMDDDRPEETGDSMQRSFQLASPGDLQLSYEIARLSENIANLEMQDTMLDNLITKAELTGDKHELKLLRESKSAMIRELRQLKFQKTQYEQQDAANRLIPDLTQVSIVSSTVGEEDGKSVVRYLIEIQQLALDGTKASGWVVARRYNEFLSMHNKLKDSYGLVRGLDFPGKRLVPALSGNVVDSRKVALEKYLQVSLILILEEFLT
jgi:sorting nexin-25